MTMINLNVVALTDDPFPAWFRDQSDRRGWSVREVAKRVADRFASGSCSQTTVGNWRNGESLPAPSNWPAIASLFEVSVEEVESMVQQSLQNREVRRLAVRLRDHQRRGRVLPPGISAGFVRLQAAA